MLRVIITLFIYFFPLFACQGGYSSCYDKVKDSHAIRGQSLYIPIEGSKLLVYSLQKPSAKILKYDPFLSLYLLKDSDPFSYPFKFNLQYPSGLASVDRRFASEGKILKKQIGLNKLAIFSHKISSPAIIVNSCCSLEGIATPKGIIQKDYLYRFVNNKDYRYGDIGIRVTNEKNKILVDSFDPFISNNPFKKGDLILEIDNFKATDSSMVMQKILFAKIGSICKVKIKRDGQIKNIKVKVYERLSGGNKVETYLEKYGLTFDKNLKIIAVDKNKKNYGLLVGDKLIRVNEHYVNNQEDVMKNVSAFRSNARLLIVRNNFQFFVNLEN